MPSSLSHWAGALAIVIIIATSALYAAGESLVRRWRRRRYPSALRPQVYRDLAAAARERQMRLERLGWAVDQTLADVVDEVGEYYDLDAFTGQPADPFGDAFLEETARTNSLHHR